MNMIFLSARNLPLLLICYEIIANIPASNALFGREVAPFQRTKIDILGIDVLTINTDAAIQKAQESGDLVKVGEASPDAKNVQWLVRNFLGNARFHESRFGWFMAMRKDQLSTRSYLDEKFCPRSFDIKNLAREAANVLDDPSNKKKDEALTRIFVNAIGGRFLPKNNSSIPSKLIKNVESKQLDGVLPALNPLNRLKSRRVVKNACTFMQEQVVEAGDVDKYNLPDSYPVDVAHSILSTAVNAVDALTSLAKDPEQSVESMMCNRDKRVDTIPRQVMIDSTLGGLLPSSKPAIAKKTVILLKVGNAAKETNDLSYAFATGPKGDKNRRCSAEPAILEFLKAVQSELKANKINKKF